MPTFAGTQEQRVFNLGLEDGAYDLQIIEVEEETGQFGPQVRVRFRVLGEETEDGNPVEFNNWYSIPINEKTRQLDPIRVGTKFGDLFSAALFAGEPFPEGAPLDTDDLIGKRVRGLLGEYLTRARPGFPSKKKFGILGLKAAKKKAAPERMSASASRKRVVEDDDDEDEDSDLRGT